MRLRCRPRRCGARSAGLIVGSLVVLSAACGKGQADAATPFGVRLGSMTPASYRSVAPPPLRHPAGFAGFGGSEKSGGKKKGGKKGGRKSKRAPGGGAATATAAGAASGASAQARLLTPEGRIAHIRSRVEEADVSALGELALTTDPSTGQMALDVNSNAVCAVDNFLGPELLGAMRVEAEGLIGTMVPSQSTRWDEETQQIVAYDKVGVLSTQIEGGEKGYAASPRLVEYVATLTGALSQKLNRILPDMHQLSGAAQTNKLAVCLGEGSKYDKHIDNLGGGDGPDGGGDRRKLTALLYLQPPDSHPAEPSFPEETEEGDEKGGYFRAYDVPQAGDVTSIAPRGDRLLMFWSDALVHDVSPSFAPNGKEDHRWALTVWLLADEKTGIIRPTDASIEDRHFGSG